MKKGYIVAVVVLVLAGLVLAGCPSLASAAEDDYPNKPIRFINATAPGGSTEAAGRRWQTIFEKIFGAPLMYEFIDGGGGVIGTVVIKEAAPDGYTLGLRPQTNLVIAPLLLKAPFAVEDFDILGSFTYDPGVFLVRKDAPYNTMEEFLAYVRTKPEKSVTISLASITDPSFLGLKQIEEAAGVKFNIVSYDGGGPARLAVVSGEVEATHTLWYGAANIWDDTKALMVHASINNVPALKGVPTIYDALKSTNYAFQDIVSSFNVIAPAGFIKQYPDRAKKLMDSLYAAWNSPEYAALLAESGMEGYTVISDSEEATANTLKVREFMEANVDKFTLE